jgi:chitin disaccharide deacetylase
MNPPALAPRGPIGSGGLLRKLGLCPNERAVVLHLDDVGMCEATVRAYRQIASRGVPASASSMVPSSWFPAVAEVCRELPASDMGVHLTLTSEWKTYRWRPLLGAHAEVLCDEDGYFHREPGRQQRECLLDVIRAELCAQVRRARAMGIDVTHLDSHMFTLFHPATFPTYASVARQLGILCVALPLGPGALHAHIEPSHREHVIAFDGWAELPLNISASRLETAKRIFDALPVGVSYLLSHPAVDSPELRGIAPDWEARVADYELYMSDEWASFLDASGLRLIGMREIRDRLVAEGAAATGARPSPNP